MPEQPYLSLAEERTRAELVRAAGGEQGTAIASCGKCRFGAEYARVELVGLVWYVDCVIHGLQPGRLITTLMSPAHVFNATRC